MRKQRLLTGIAGILMAFLFTGCNTSSVEEWVDEVVEDINGQIPDNTLLPVESVSEEKYVYGQHLIINKLFFFRKLAIYIF